MVYWYLVTASTNNKDRTQDEEFGGRRSSHLEQFTNRRVICNSLPFVIRTSSKGSLVLLTDIASEDYS